jgi:UDP-GlcNAc:undecaprenyl-phosphate GlcNAc-1-phosphate transferase
MWSSVSINSVNLLDGADGLATTVGIIACGAIAVMASLTGHFMDAAIAAAMVGALLGFLVFNFPPASIFLGDAGSMLIGLLVGILAIRSALKGPATVALGAPLAVMAIPILDSTAAVVRRRLTGRSIYAPDRAHLHHALLRKGLSARMVLLIVSLMCLGTASGALIGVFMKNESIALVTTVSVIGIVVSTKAFGFSEMVLIARRSHAFIESLVTATVPQTTRVRQQTIRLQGSRNWEELWSTLTDFADLHGLCWVELDLNAAWMHEGYHAQWRRDVPLERDECWSIRLPLVSMERHIGRLEVCGPVLSEPANGILALAVELIESLEPCLARLSDDLPRVESGAPLALEDSADESYPTPHITPAPQGAGGQN